MQNVLCKCCGAGIPVFDGMPEDHPKYPNRCPMCERRDGACLHNISERIAAGDRRFHYSSEGMRESGVSVRSPRFE